MTRVKMIACCTVAVAALAGIAAAIASRTPRQAVATTRILGPANPATNIGASLVLRLPGQGALDRFLATSQNPHSRAHGQTLSPDAFGARFGLSQKVIALVSASLAAHGLTVERTYPQRTALRVSGSAGAWEDAFSVRLQDRLDAQGRRYLAPASAPRLPGWLGGEVLGVTGLDTRPVMTAADIPAAGLTPATVAAAYDFAPLRRAGIDGAGQTVAVISYDDYEDEDLASYESHFGIGGPAVQRVPVDGGTFPGSQQAEVNLDLDTIRGIAPGAQVLDYDAPQGQASDADVINQIVADHRAQVISTSWGICDLLVSPALRAADQNALAAARAAGITIFAASGDNGAYDCQSADLGDHRLSVDWPAASDDVVAVGGTHLSIGQNGAYQAEYGWEDVLADSGSGGGLASVTPRPSWQVGAGLQNNFSNGHRQVPDVAGPADPVTGMAVVVGGAFHEVGGTSAAAPFWAAVTLLMREYAQRHGVAQLGFMAPLLYEIANNPATANAFHEPVRGGNRWYSIGPGWNYVAGLGSPDVTALARDLVALETGKS